MEMPTFEPADVAIVEDAMNQLAGKRRASTDHVQPYEALATAAKLVRYAFASDEDYRAPFHLSDTPHVVNDAGDTDLSELAGLLDAVAQAGGFPT